ncbi:MAG: IS91 family transposase [Gammaproteobacteria bacterium]|nr:IS91 family transposase [Gammaproteobacteria bacterium]
MLDSKGRPCFEVADVVRTYSSDYLLSRQVSAAQQAVLRHISDCRTPALGGHVETCDSCDHRRISYNSCRDRHCPKCQNAARAEWITKRLERLLPVPYFHVVFTIPDVLNPLALRNKRVVFNILFAAASQSLQTIASDERHLGAQVGFTSVLHTWGQNLLFHPHVHCVVTGGGLSPDGASFIRARESYLLPVKVLGSLFRGKFLAALETAYKEGDLDLAGSTVELANSAAWQRFKNGLYDKDWVVYSKAPFGGSEHVFRYLGNYTHRIAISNHRIVNVNNGKVTFGVKDYKDGCKKKLLTLDATEFLRRFLLHVLPRGFVRIRHYGLCASANVNTKLVAARKLLEPNVEIQDNNGGEQQTPLPWWQRFLEQTGIDVMACPICEQGRISRVLSLSPSEIAEHLLPTINTS